MTDLVDQMFPPINRKTAPDFTDFNFWRAPVTQFDLPDFSPPSPALSARSDSSRLTFPRLGSLASSLSRRSSRQTLVEGPTTTAGAGGRGARTGTPSSPLLQATLVEEPVGVEDYEDELEQRSESESMPGSLPNDADFERLRAAAQLRNGRTEAEQYKAKVKADEEEEEEEYDEEEEEEEEEGLEEEQDEFGDQMDFSSVPVRFAFSLWWPKVGGADFPCRLNSTSRRTRLALV
jgi:phosphatidate phosphatase LPIN